MRSVLGMLLTVGLSPIWASEPPSVRSAMPAPEIDSLFQRSDGWIGGDGAYSVSLTATKTVWLFSDTWVGKVRNGRRSDATIVNNTIGLQAGKAGNLKYTIATGPDGKPKALFVPADGRGWFWLQAGAYDDDQLTVFLAQVEKTGDKGVFGFRCVGQWLGTVANATESPKDWRIQQVKLPNTIFTKNRILSWGAATLRVGENLYVYGIDERRDGGFPNRQMVLARVPVASVGNFSKWRYFVDGTWHEDYHDPTRLAQNIASEYSVTAFGQQYLAIYTEAGLSPRIMGRFAEKPWGPWSAAAVLYECPEMSRAKKLFCYAAKAHPSLSSDNEVVVSYVVNSFDFWQVAREADLYWPRFIRVKLAAPAQK